MNYYCPKCSFSSCLDCEDSGRLNHPHPVLFKMKVLTVVSPPDFYNDLLEGKKRFCDQCKGKLPLPLRPYNDSLRWPPARIKG